MSKRTIDTVITFRILKLLTTPWKDHEAFKLGLIDGNGKRDKTKKLKTKEEKNAYTFLHRLVFNLKRLIEMLPLGKTKLASYATALFLIKEHTGLTSNQLDKEVLKYLKEAVDSIKNQTFKQFKCYFLIDGPITSDLNDFLRAS